MCRGEEVEGGGRSAGLLHMLLLQGPAKLACRYCQGPGEPPRQSKTQGLLEFCRRRALQIGCARAVPKEAAGIPDARRSCAAGDVRS